MNSRIKQLKTLIKAMLSKIFRKENVVRSNSKGKKWSREDIYEERLARYDK